MNTKLAEGWKLGVKVGGKELIFSGSVHLDQESVEIEFDDMFIVFNFLTDGGQSRYAAKAEGTQKLIFELFNHNNVLGEGVLSPIEIGFHEKRKLYITYFVSTLRAGENARRMEFAFYVGEPV